MDEKKETYIGIRILKDYVYLFVIPKITVLGSYSFYRI